MEIARWISEHWLDLIPTLAVVATLALDAYVSWRDERARRASNSIAVTDQHRAVTKDALILAPRVYDENADVENFGITLAERVIITNFVAHLSMVFRIKQYGEFVNLEGLAKDVREFFSLPLPKMVWKNIKAFQNEDFVSFIESNTDEKSQRNLRAEAQNIL